LFSYMIWKLVSTPPHDFFLSLDVNEYFDYEHQPDQIFEKGFTRPIPIGDQDIIVTIYFNGDPDNPEFSIHTTETLSSGDQDRANKSISRILGLNLDLRPFYDQAADDPVLAPMMKE